MLLSEFPVLRQDQAMMRGYLFILDVLEEIGKSTARLVQTNQNLMQSLLEASKVSEEYLDEFIRTKADEVSAFPTSDQCLPS